MPSSKRDAEKLRAFCADVFEDDGVNPSEDKRIDARQNNKCDRKLDQLCRQVEQNLQLVFPGANVPGDARIAGVEPAPNAGRMRVTVSVCVGCDLAQVSDALDRCKGYLRTEVAQAISRRRAPELVFTVVTDSPNPTPESNDQEESDHA